MSGPSDFIRRFPTVDDYLRHVEQAGHVCCACFTHNNLPCCNDGHYHAMAIVLEYDRIVSGLRGEGAEQ